MMRSLPLMMLVIFSALTWSAEAKLTNVVTEWINATQARVAVLGVHNVPASRWYAQTALAIHNAVAAGGAPPQALAAYAGYTIVSGNFPGSQANYDVLLKKQLAGISEKDRAAAAAIAVPIADEILRDNAGGEFTRNKPFEPAAAGTLYAYQFVPNQTFAIYPQAVNVTPFVLSKSEADAIAYNTDPAKGQVFKPPKSDYQATYDLGAKNSKTRSKYDTDSAWFWMLAGNTSTITGATFDIAIAVLPADYSIEDTALFFARAALANYDTQLTGWRVKYNNPHWRPITAFRTGYPGFKAQPDWEALIPIPAHPEYPSGHTFTVGAVLEVLNRTLNGKDDVTFQLTSESTPWITRTYKSLSQAAKESADSRQYAGVHFPSANYDGLKLGKLVASKVYDRIQPKQAVVTQQRKVAKGAPAVVSTEAGPKAAATGRRRLRWL